MTNPTSNFGWQMPTATDLVTDLPADFEVFGQAVDTSMADLKGGTTGQILSKNSNTDMDFIWTSANPGDITAVNTTAPLQGGATSGAVTLSVDAATTAAAGVVQLTNSVSSTSITTAAVPANVKTAYDLAAAAVPLSTVTTSGDLIYGTGASTVTRRAIGTTGQVLTVSGGVPTWATPASGSMTSLASGSLSGASVSLTSIDQTYKALRLVIQSASLTGSDQAVLRFNGDSSTSYCQGGAYSGPTSGVYSQIGTIFKLNATNASAAQTNHSYVVDFPNYAQTSTVKLISGNCAYYNITNSGWANFLTGCTYFSNSAITSIQMVADYGGSFTWDSGTYVLYGVN